MVTRFLSLFHPPPAQPVAFASETEMRKTYGYWRTRQLYTTFIGYAVFYFVRKNFPLAMPGMETGLGLSKADLGKMLTWHDIVYGVSKFLNGILADRSNPRFFMSLALILSALANLAFGASSVFWVLITLWVLNGWFQGMGFPPCARVLSHWFSPHERGTFWGLWNTSHQVGLAVILVLAGWIAGSSLGWRYVFFVPAAIAMVVGLFIMERLRDTPASVGLPDVEHYTGPGREASPQAKPPTHDERIISGPIRLGGSEPSETSHFFEFLMHHVFSNKYIWYACIANFFVYVVRYGFVNWGPSYLQQVKKVSSLASGGMVAGFEVAGLLGSLLAGWLTDRYFGSRRGPVCVIYMVATTVATIAFWKVPPGHPWLDACLLTSVGFLIYGPQFLVGVMTADLATKRAAATAIGMTGFFGYMSGVVSGWGLGSIVDKHGWDAAFAVLVGCSVAATIPFALTWNACAAPEETNPGATVAR